MFQYIYIIFIPLEFAQSLLYTSWYFLESSFLSWTPIWVWLRHNPQNSLRLFFSIASVLLTSSIAFTEFNMALFAMPCSMFWSLILLYEFSFTYILIESSAFFRYSVMLKLRSSNTYESFSLGMQLRPCNITHTY